MMDMEILTKMSNEIKFKVFSVRRNCWLAPVLDNRFSFILPDAEQNSFYGYKYVTLHDALNSALYRVFRMTNEKTKDGREVYEGDILTFSHTFVSYTYPQSDIYQRGNPTVSEERKRVYAAEVVFGEITGIDDFYCPKIVGWGIRERTSDTVYSLRDAVEEHSGRDIIHLPYGKTISASWSVVGNICENPELINEELCAS